MRGFCYMLECSAGSYYVGSTTALSARLYQHQTGKGAAYTRRRPPVRLVWVEEYPRVGDAFAREKQVQGWGRAKRKAPIAYAYGDLPELSRNYTEHGQPPGLDKLDQPDGPQPT